MDYGWYQRIEERDRGRSLVRHVTGWLAAGAAVLVAAFGVMLARHDQAAANPAGAGQDQVTDDTNGTDDGGVVVPPPAQPPTRSGHRGFLQSGGS